MSQPDELDQVAEDVAGKLATWTEQPPSALPPTDHHIPETTFPRPLRVVVDVHPDTVADILTFAENPTVAPSISADAITRHVRNYIDQLLSEPVHYTRDHWLARLTQLQTLDLTDITDPDNRRDPRNPT